MEKEKNGQLQNKKDVLPMEAFMENLPTGFLVCDVTDTPEILYIGDATFAIFGTNRQEYEKCADLLPSAEKFLQVIESEMDFEQLRLSGEKQKAVFPAKKIDGEFIWIQMLCTIRSTEEGRMLCYATLWDATQWVEDNRKCELFRILVEDTQMLTVDYDVKMDIANISIRFPDRTHFDRKVENYVAYLRNKSALDAEFRENLAIRIKEACKKETSECYEYLADYYGLGCAWYRLQYKSLVDETGRVYRVVGSACDITEEREQSAYWKHMTEKDELSGLYNRRVTESLINKKLSSVKKSEKYALLVVSIDNLKIINEQYGHAAGDKTIQKIAETLCSFFRTEDVVGRVGGDEFCVLFNVGGAYENAISRAVAIMDKVRLLRDKLGFDSSLSVSVGITQVPAHGRTFAALLGNSNKALYQAKRRGKDCYCVYNQSEDGSQAQW